MKRSRLSGIVLRAGLERLDRARDRGHGRAELVRGVGDELALGLHAALLLGDVGEDEHRELGRRRRHADERDRRAVLAPAARLGDRRPRHEQPFGDAAQRQPAVRLGQRRALVELDAR